MIPPSAQIWLVAGVTDMRRGYASLSGLVQTSFDKSPLSGNVFIFRGRRADLIKIVWHDSEGMCLLISKRQTNACRIICGCFAAQAAGVRSATL